MGMYKQADGVFGRIKNKVQTSLNDPAAMQKAYSDYQKAHPYYVSGGHDSSSDRGWISKANPGKSIMDAGIFGATIPKGYTMDPSVAERMGFIPREYNGRWYHPDAYTSAMQMGLIPSGQKRPRSPETQACYKSRTEGIKQAQNDNNANIRNIMRAQTAVENFTDGYIGWVFNNPITRYINYKLHPDDLPVWQSGKGLGTIRQQRLNENDASEYEAAGGDPANLNRLGAAALLTGKGARWLTPGFTSGGPAARIVESGLHWANMSDVVPTYNAAKALFTGDRGALELGYGDPGKAFVGGAALGALGELGKAIMPSKPPATVTSSAPDLHKPVMDRIKTGLKWLGRKVVSDMVGGTATNYTSDVLDIALNPTRKFNELRYDTEKLGYFTGPILWTGAMMVPELRRRGLERDTKARKLWLNNAFENPMFGEKALQYMTGQDVRVDDPDYDKRSPAEKTEVLKKQNKQYNQLERLKSKY